VQGGFFEWGFYVGFWVSAQVSQPCINGCMEGQWNTMILALFFLHPINENEYDRI